MLGSVFQVHEVFVNASHYSYREDVGVSVDDIRDFDFQTLNDGQDTQVTLVLGVILDIICLISILMFICFDSVRSREAYTISFLLSPIALLAY